MDCSATPNTNGSQPSLFPPPDPDGGDDDGWTLVKKKKWASRGQIRVTVRFLLWLVLQDHGCGVNTTAFCQGLAIYLQVYERDGLKWQRRFSVSVKAQSLKDPAHTAACSLVSAWRNFSCTEWDPGTASGMKALRSLKLFHLQQMGSHLLFLSPSCGLKC